MFNRFRVYMVMCLLYLTVSITGCSNEKENTNENVQEKTTQEENEQEENVEETDNLIKIDTSQQEVYYKEWFEKWHETKIDEVPKVGEMGNEYSFDENLLGYYTNGYVGMYIYQIYGSQVMIDNFLFDYYIGSSSAEVMDVNAISFVYQDGMTQTDIYSGDGIYKSELNHLETNTVFSENSFAIDSTAQLNDNYIPYLLGENMMPYFLDVGMDSNSNSYDKFDSIVLGVYDKKDINEVAGELKMMNAYDPLLYELTGTTNEFGSTECYYENNQPLTDRISKESYPKYVRYVPQYKYYISGGDPDKKEDFLLVKIMTGEDSELDADMWSSIKVKLGAFHFNEEDGKWYSNMGTIKHDADEYDASVIIKGILKNCGNSDCDEFTFTNFNYEVPEYVCTTIEDTDGYVEAEEIVKEGMRANSGRFNVRRLVLDFSDGENVKFKFVDGRNKLFTDMQMYVPPIIDDKKGYTLFNITEDTVFVPVTDMTFLESLGIN